LLSLFNLLSFGPLYWPGRLRSVHKKIGFTVCHRSLRDNLRTGFWNGLTRAVRLLPAILVGSTLPTPSPTAATTWTALFPVGPISAIGRFLAAVSGTSIEVRLPLL